VELDSDPAPAPDTPRARPKTVCGPLNFLTAGPGRIV
jgi:hypothetical protein